MFKRENLEHLKNANEGDLVTIKYPSGNSCTYVIKEMINNELYGYENGGFGIREKIDIDIGKITNIGMRN